MPTIGDPIQSALEQARGAAAELARTRGAQRGSIDSALGDLRTAIRKLEEVKKGR